MKTDHGFISSGCEIDTQCVEYLLVIFLIAAKLELSSHGDRR
ncbi:MAG TPA: hypothetical protein VIM41_02765 [Gammaproteobacteria bacterium]